MVASTQVFRVLGGLGLVKNFFANASPAIESNTLPVPQTTFSDYAPVYTSCSSDQNWIRSASSGLSSQESQWVHGRKIKVASALENYLNNLNLDSFDVDGYITKIKSNDYANVPTIGYAISGGGWESATTGTGPLLAFDARVSDSVMQRTGGLLQSLTYTSGLSGGSWPVMSLATHNFPAINDMVASWHADLNRFDVAQNTAYAVTFQTLFEQLVPKAKAGFNISMPEFMGRAFAYEFVAGAEGGLGTTLSSVTGLSNFKNHEMPFPLWQAAALAPDDIEFFGLEVPFFNATIYEMNPFEFGAWSGGVSGFFPMAYLGTTMNNGAPVDKCVIGFDRASFILGAAAGAPNAWWIQDKSDQTLAGFPKRSVKDSLETQLDRRFAITPLEELAETFKKYFNYTLSESIDISLPNPFAVQDEPTNLRPLALNLVDNSESGQALPLWTQIQPARSPEFIIAWDDDEDGLPYGWNNGTNMYNTYHYAQSAGIPFPIVPSPNYFIEQNYTHKPVLFGCDANLTTTKDERSPIILYLANAPYSAYTNYSHTQQTFTSEQMSGILGNGFNIVTQGNGTLDAEWPECLGCAAIDRSLSKLGMKRTEQCEKCMSRYCWDGSGAGEAYDPMHHVVIDLPMVLDPGVDYVEWNRTGGESISSTSHANAASGHGVSLSIILVALGLGIAFTRA